MAKRLSRRSLGRFRPLTRIWSPDSSVEALRAAYDFKNLQDFLNLYYQATRALLTERDFHDLASAYLARARAQNIRHAEIFFDPQARTRRGVPLAAIVKGIGAALDEASRSNGPTTRLIACFLRDLDAADAMRTLDSLLPWRARIVGVGLDSAEANDPPAKFAETFSQARGLEFRAVAHAGEEGPAAFVADALDKLGAERIDHGVRAIEDPELVARLVREQVPLTVCPLSNIRLRVYSDMPHRPVSRLIDAGVLVTINSDDPAYFGGYVNANYRAVQEAFDLTTSELAALAKASFAASWLEPAEKATKIEEVQCNCIFSVSTRREPARPDIPEHYRWPVLGLSARFGDATRSVLACRYATGVFSSRKLERATYDSVAFRFIAANDHPDHDTIAAFRRRFLKETGALFVQVLPLAREMDVLKMGTVALDGTKIHANASRHGALSYEHVAAADRKDLNPSIGRAIRLMAR